LGERKSPERAFKADVFTLMELVVVIGFADGHSEVHRWVDGRTRVPAVNAGRQTQSPNNPDILWLQQRTSALAN
jgi:hypothetical protein